MKLTRSNCAAAAALLALAGVVSGTAQRCRHAGDAGDCRSRNQRLHTGKIRLVRPGQQPMPLRRRSSTARCSTGSSSRCVARRRRYAVIRNDGRAIGGIVPVQGAQWRHGGCALAVLCFGGKTWIARDRRDDGRWRAGAVAGDCRSGSRHACPAARFAGRDHWPAAILQRRSRPTRRWRRANSSGWISMRAIRPRRPMPTSSSATSCTRTKCRAMTGWCFLRRDMRVPASCACLRTVGTRLASLCAGR